VDGLYGILVKVQRQETLEDFCQGRIHLLAASDLAARGLDIQGVTPIINLDIPEDPRLYLHRPGTKDWPFGSLRPGKLPS